MIDSMATMLRKLYQSHAEGNTCPMAMKLPTDLYASVLGVNTSFMSLRYPPIEENVFLTPAGMAAASVYLWVFTSGASR